MSNQQEIENDRKREEKLNLRELLTNYDHVLRNFITPLPLLDLMPSFRPDSDVRHTIANLHDDPDRQVSEFLKVLEQCDEPGTRQSFLDALNNSEDHQWIYRFINGDLDDKELEKFINHCNNIEKIKQLFRVIKPLLNVINVEHCINLLSPWLSDGERDSLKAKHREMGGTYTIWWMIHYCTRKEPGWLKEFYRHIEEANYGCDGTRTLAVAFRDYIDLGDMNDDQDQSTFTETGSSVAGRQNGTINTENLTEDEEETLKIQVGEENSEKDLNDLNVGNNSDIKQITNSIDSSASYSPAEAHEKQRHELRGYQKELVELAEKGQNVIVCAPPGSGKTIVAAHIILNYLEKNCNNRRKVFFFTPGGTLARQQKDRLREYLPSEYLVDFRCGRAESSSLLEVIKTDVIVLTPQILLNELNRKENSKFIKGLDDVDLMIFDECHHCMKGHPYNAIMRKYFYIRDEKKLPQIVGLTATLGVGKSPKGALKEIKQLCANLAAVDGVVSVRKRDNIEELNKFTPHPEEDTISLGGRDKDPFYLRIISLMNAVGDHLKSTKVCSTIPEYEDDEDRKQQYKQWCVQSMDEIAKSNNSQARDAISCIEYLDMCGDALDLHTKCRAVNAVVYLQDKMVSVKATNTMDENLLKKLTDAMDELKDLSQDPRCANPNLQKIECMITEKFQTAKDKATKGMLMVQKRLYVKALTEWMRETESLQFLNAEGFTGLGSNTNASNTGLSHNQQEIIIKEFREGKHKLLICTPESAGEGIDVAECDLVIEYDFLKSEISAVQTKGRIRKHGGEMILLSSPKVAHRDVLNLQKTIVMHKATKQLQILIDTDKLSYQQELLNIQRESALLYQVDVLKKLNKRPQTTDQEYQLQCRKCHIDVCSSNDIRVVEGGHHVNPNEEFKEKYGIKDHPRITRMDEGWKKKKKVFCKKCRKDWGIMAEWKGVVTLPLIKIQGLKAVNMSRGTQYTPRRWKDCPFAPIEASLEEMVELLDSVNDSE